MDEEMSPGEGDAGAEARESLAAARSALRWSRPEAARRAGVHRNTVLRWETNDEQWEPRLKYLKVLLQGGSPVARGIILRLLDLEPGPTVEKAPAEYNALMRRAFEKREEPAVAQILDLLRTLLGEDVSEDAATTA